MVNNMLDRSIRVFLITEELPAVILITEGMIGTEGVGATMMTIEEAAGMEEATIEIDVEDAAGPGAEVTAVAVEVPVLSIDAVVEAVQEIDLDAIATPGVVLRIAIRVGMQVLHTEWVVRRQECFNLLLRHHLVVQIICRCRWDSNFSRDKHR